MSKDKTLKERRKEAEVIVIQLQNELSEAIKSVKDAQAELTETEFFKKEYKKLVPEINKITRSTNSAIEKIRGDRTRLSSLMTSVNNFYNKKYLPLSEKIENEETGFKARLRVGAQFEKEIDQLRNIISKQVDLVKDLVGQTKKKVDELKKIESLLRQIEPKIIKHEKSVFAMRTKIEESAVKVEASSNIITTAELEILVKKKEIDKFRNDAEKAVGQINIWQNEAQIKLEKIQTIYEIAAGTGLGGEFDKKRKLLNEELVKWRKQLLLTTIVLFTIIVSLFLLQLSAKSVNWDVSSLKFDGNFYVRFLLTSPIIFYLVFVTSQFNKTKSLLEKYSFKTTLSLTIEAHINLLTNIDKLQDKENLDKIANFILDGFSKIYSEPYFKEGVNNETKMFGTLESIRNKIPI